MLFDNPPLHNFPDRAFRQALLDARNLRDVMVDAMPDHAPNMDFGKAEYHNPEFSLEDWRGREADLLVRLPYRDPEENATEVLICLLLEHQSKPDPQMPLRVLISAALFWEQQWKEYEAKHPPGEGMRLTPMLPVIFHTGQREWNSNRSVGELFAGS